MEAVRLRLHASAVAPELRPASPVIGAVASLAASIVPGHRLGIPVEQTPAALGRHMRTIAGIVLVLGNGVPKLEAIENDLAVPARILVVMMMAASFNHDFLQ